MIQNQQMFGYLEFVFDHFPLNIQSDYGRTIVDTIIRGKELLETEDFVILELPEGLMKQ
jgi:hypothetical protein